MLAALNELMKDLYASPRLTAGAPSASGCWSGVQVLLFCRCDHWFLRPSLQGGPRSRSPKDGVKSLAAPRPQQPGNPYTRPGPSKSSTQGRTGESNARWRFRRQGHGGPGVIGEPGRHTTEEWAMTELPAGTMPYSTGTGSPAPQIER